MTRRAPISSALRKWAVAEVERSGVAVTLEGPDGTKVTVAPAAQPSEHLSPYDKWKRSQETGHH